MRILHLKKLSTLPLLVIFFAFLIALITNYQFSITPTFAEPNCDSPGPGDFDFCIQRIQQEIDALKPAHEYNKQELAGLQKQLADLERRITNISDQLDKVESEILVREKDLAFAVNIFQEKTHNHYKFIRLYDPLLPFLSATDATE